ncbi:TerC/Alx family metal homeostasis membrane protein [Mycobacterium sp. 1274756.6]|uniref:TerC/Alx family metal homeostasis membrane protein n=1 Tax=Mycobacterium sp. 1274756.6 TaxID=1834076 RepID=UPI000800514B|nr:TerC/Alx family metal homeostasis membrane protein [Mycobacterium sp. 1274756.6]OBJ70626.1 tellurium resistance protein TerC [Mycobacterium sp. 1274756.6]
MNVSTLEWAVTLTVTITVLLIDIAFTARNPHEPAGRRLVAALSAYIGLAVLFGAWVWAYHGSRYGLQFYAGWLTEYSLSVDNLFVFIIIMASFKVPKIYQQQALLVGITLALLLRGIFIGLGALAIEQFSWIFYIFGAFLLYTGLKVWREFSHDAPDNRVVRAARRYFNTTDSWHGLRLFVRNGAGRAMTPMFLVIVALGTTDLVFALDSIPAVYGLTREPYLVFTANVFALMGLRQLYFLLGKLLQRLVYLSKGLALILCFIAVKMLLQALRGNDLPFLNGGQPIPVPEIRTWVSLVVIVATVAVTTAASLYRTRRLAPSDDTE